MWGYKELILGLGAKLEKLTATFTVTRTYIHIQMKETQQITTQIKALSDRIAELSLKIDALHVQHLYPAPPPKVPSMPDFQVPNMFDELPLGNNQGFKLEELVLDAGYKEQV
jgi:hypothetical protein